jgi:hypothetical protein
MKTRVAWIDPFLLVVPRSVAGHLQDHAARYSVTGGDGAVSHLDVLGDAAILVQSWSLEGHLKGHGARPVPERILHTLKLRCQLVDV